MRDIRSRNNNFTILFKKLKKKKEGIELKSRILNNE